MITYNKSIKLHNTLSGYVYFCDTSHPLANGSGRVLYHRHILSLAIGRWLTCGEVVHHIDRNKTNNDPNNLQLLTLSEHTKIHVKDGLLGHKIGKPIIYKCSSCGRNFSPSNRRKARFCSLKCNAFYQRKVTRPTKEELSKLIWELPTIQLAKKFNISDKALEKWCKTYGIDKPPRGYWAKKYPMKSVKFKYTNVTLTCLMCGNKFNKKKEDLAKTLASIRRGKKGPFCSIKCSYNYRSSKRIKKI